MKHNVIRQWLLNVRKEFASPEEMEKALPTVRDPNTRKLIERELVDWYLELRQRK